MTILLIISHRKRDKNDQSLISAQMTKRRKNKRKFLTVKKYQKSDNIIKQVNTKG